MSQQKSKASHSHFFRSFWSKAKAEISSNFFYLMGHGHQAPMEGLPSKTPQRLWLAFTRKDTNGVKRHGTNDEKSMMSF